ncbi:LOW QUALITY PROTEIN: hypothetical protein MAR_036113 [Mya arenaria]|uniref:YqaJ viral recombinase domain-containing protein n=1 Tax=Mya arenaria TaxID=6604 RepID=A0ABY7EQ11_MYAAR|nr:LOW QUALITY PROTEIN: hypothetical protein MAR_036113 [Mya arenaria]
MPIFTLEVVFIVEGCVQVFDEDTLPFLVVSPDGSLHESFESTKVAVEIKCPLYAYTPNFLRDIICNVRLISFMLDGQIHFSI